MTDPGAQLGQAEHALFTGPPAAATPLLEQLLATTPPGPHTDRATWLLGVSLLVVGRYGAALSVLTPLVQAAGAPGAPAVRREAGALAGAAVAGAHRQLGRHATAREADTAALRLAGPAAEPAFDALLGLAGDAVGLQEVDEARLRLAEAERLADAAPASWWRQRVRLDRVRAETALLDGRPDDAAARATAAVRAAAEAGARRHVAKGLLVLGLTQVSAGSAAATGTLREAAELAGALGALPLVWPSRALLAALLAERDPAGARACLAEARAAVEAVAADLPPGVRAAWLARPEVAALLPQA